MKIRNGWIGALIVSAALAACGQDAAVPAAPADVEVPAVPASLPAADYVLDAAQSRLSFVSIKAGDIVETHRFDDITGGVAADGQGELRVALASVNTGVDIRNERMRDAFFEVDTYPEATATVSIDPSVFEDLTVGDRRTIALSADLSLHGASVPVDTDVVVTRLSENSVSVDTLAPVSVVAAAHDLGAGVETLREMAGLDQITPASLVTFTLVFDAATSG
ncbi:MAG: YceI family protein [Pseudomonadota bacterium]